MAPAVPTYAPRDAGDTVLYKVIAEHLETFLASLHDDPEATGLPAYVQREFYDHLPCGMLTQGFWRLGGARLGLLQYTGAHVSPGDCGAHPVTYTKATHRLFRFGVHAQGQDQGDDLPP
jgi:hypothetical protein